MTFVDFFTGGKYMRRIAAVLWLVLLLAGCTTHLPTQPTLTSATRTASPGPTSSPTSTLFPTRRPHTPTPDLYTISAENVGALTYITGFGDDWINNISWSPDGNRMVVSVTGAVELYNMQTYERVWSTNIAEALGVCDDCLLSGVEMAAFHPNGEQIAVAFHDGQKNVSLWDAEDGSFVRFLEAPLSPVRALEYSPDGKLLAGCDALDSTTVYIWNTQTGQILHELQDDALSVYAIDFHPDGKQLLTGGFDGYVRLWDSQSGELLQRLPVDLSIFGVAFSPNGQFLAAVGSWYGEYTFIWDASGKPLHQFKEDGEGDNQEVIFSPNSDLVLTGNDRGLLRMYDVASGKLLRSIDRLSSISDIAFRPDGRIFAVGSQDGNVRLFGPSQVARQMPTPQPQANQQMIDNYTSLPPGQYVVYSTYEQGTSSMHVVSMDGSIQKLLAEDVAGHSMSADGRLIQISYDIAGSLNLLNGITTKYPTGGFLSPDQTKTMRRGCAGNPGLQITRLATGEDLCIPVEMKNYEGVMREMIFAPWSPDGRWIAYFITSMDGRHNPPQAVQKPGDGLYLIDTSCLAEPTGCTKKTAGPFYYPGVQYDSYMTWSPDSQILAFHTYGVDQFLLFHLQSQQYTAIQQEGLANRFAISPDNQWLAYQTEGKHVVIQNIHGGPVRNVLENVESVEVLFWLTAPVLKTGQTFVITPAGDNLNLREAPSLSANSIIKLRSHEKITVLDGPVQADGYTWWHIRTEKEGTEGWAVEYYGWFAEAE